jgi:ATP adenylyltransferase
MPSRRPYAEVLYTCSMDRLWTPWRYNYVTGAKPAKRKGVPDALDPWPGPDRNCVFCNLIASVEWAVGNATDPEQIARAEKAGLVLERLETCFVCLNAYPYTSGHLLIVPYSHTDSLANLDRSAAHELIRTAQRVETALRQVYHPDGLNFGMNLGESAGAGVADHLHLHALPRWVGDTNFMSVTAETRVLPEALDDTWSRLRDSLHLLEQA